MSPALLFAATFLLFQDNPEPRLEQNIPPDQMWEIADDWSIWLRHLLQENRSREFLASVDGAIRKLPGPYGSPFKEVRQRFTSMYVPLTSHTSEERRAHVALERIRILKLLGGFEELIADIVGELARPRPMWQVLGPEQITQDALLGDLAWAQARIGHFEAATVTYKKLTQPPNDAFLSRLKDAAELAAPTCWEVNLSTFRWLRRELAASRISARRAELTYAVFRLVGAAGDPGAGHSMVARMLREPDAPEWAKVEALVVELRAASQRNDFRECERILGQIVAKHKSAPQYYEMLLRRATWQASLRLRAQALQSYEEWLKSYEEKRILRLGDDRAYQAGQVQRSISEIHVQERRWDKALEASLAARDVHPIRGGCGNCNYSRHVEDELRVARCLSRVGRREGALEILDKLPAGDDGLMTPWGVRAMVEASVGGPREAEFRKRIESAVETHKSSYYRHEAGAYVTVLKAEAAGDASTLVDVLMKVFPSVSRPFEEKKWEETLRVQGWVGAETLDRLYRMPEKAIPLLKDKVAAGSRTALVALAYFDHPDAVALIRDADWIPEDLRTLLEPCRKISVRWVK